MKTHVCDAHSLFDEVETQPFLWQGRLFLVLSPPEVVMLEKQSPAGCKDSQVRALFSEWGALATIAMTNVGSRDARGSWVGSPGLLRGSGRDELIFIFFGAPLVPNVQPERVGKGSCMGSPSNCGRQSPPQFSAMLRSARRLEVILLNDMDGQIRQWYNQDHASYNQTRIGAVREVRRDHDRGGLPPLQVHICGH